MRQSFSISLPELSKAMAKEFGIYQVETSTAEQVEDTISNAIGFLELDRVIEVATGECKITGEKAIITVQLFDYDTAASEFLKALKTLQGRLGIKA